MEPLEGKFISRTNNVGGRDTEKPQEKIPLITIEIQDVTEDDYCPYCNLRYPIEKMTDEHVIPQSIGGDDRLVIRVCKDCNSNMGSKVDTALSRHSLLRMMGIKPNNGPKYLERHPSTAKLKDGTILHGSFYIEFLTSYSFKPAFEPLKNQPNGSKWLHAKIVAKNSSLPNDINIYHPEDLEEVTFSNPDPLESELQRAFVKILLGFLYKVWGRVVVENSAFNIFREYLVGVTGSGISFLRAGPEKEELPNYVHKVWCSSEGQKLRGGISLFGKVTLLIEVENFVVTLPFIVMEYESRNFLK